MVLSFNDFKKAFYDLSIFRVLYVISLLFESVSFTETLFGWVSGIFIFWGFILSVNIIFNDSDKLNIRGKNEAILFLFLRENLFLFDILIILIKVHLEELN